MSKKLPKKSHQISPPQIHKVYEVAHSHTKVISIVASGTDHPPILVQRSSDCPVSLKKFKQILNSLLKTEKTHLLSCQSRAVRKTFQLSCGILMHSLLNLAPERNSLGKYYVRNSIFFSFTFFFLFFWVVAKREARSSCFSLICSELVLTWQN